jgi:hypothetical protein
MEQDVTVATLPNDPTMAQPPIRGSHTVEALGGDKVRIRDLELFLAFDPSIDPDDDEEIKAFGPEQIDEVLAKTRAYMDRGTNPKLVVQHESEDHETDPTAVGDVVAVRKKQIHGTTGISGDVEMSRGDFEALIASNRYPRRSAEIWPDGFMSEVALLGRHTPRRPLPDTKFAQRGEKVVCLRTFAADFDEDKHPRDQDGQFTSIKEGVGDRTPAKGEQIYDDRRFDIKAGNRVKNPMTGKVGTVKAVLQHRGATLLEMDWDEPDKKLAGDPEVFYYADDLKLVGRRPGRKRKFGCGPGAGNVFIPAEGTGKRRKKGRQTMANEDDNGNGNGDGDRDKLIDRLRNQISEKEGDLEELRARMRKMQKDDEDEDEPDKEENEKDDEEEEDDEDKGEKFKGARIEALEEENRKLRVGAKRQEMDRLLDKMEREGYMIKADRKALLEELVVADDPKAKVKLWRGLIRQSSINVRLPVHEFGTGDGEEADAAKPTMERLRALTADTQKLVCDRARDRQIDEKRGGIQEYEKILGEEIEKVA